VFHLKAPVNIMAAAILAKMIFVSFQFFTNPEFELTNDLWIIHPKPNTMTILRWTLFTTAGWILGLLLALTIGEPLSEINLSGLDIGGGIGAGIVIMQWLALRKYTKIRANWIWLGILGVSGPFLLSDLLFILANLILTVKVTGDAFIYVAPLAATGGGLLAGWLQHRFILSKIFNQSKSWILYNGLGWMTCSLVITGYAYITMFLMHLGRTPLVGIMNAIILVLGGPIIIGVISAKGIISVLRSRIE